MPQILKVAAIAVATAGTGAATMSVMNEDIPDLAGPDGSWAAGGELDGISFEIVGTHLGTGAGMTDVIHFRDGTFQSADCQEYCDFGWSGYETKVIDGVIHFTARTTCPDAPHTVVWYGRVDGDEMALDGTWTTRRWYWTNQIAFSGGGVALPPAADAVAG